MDGANTTPLTMPSTAPLLGSVINQSHNGIREELEAIASERYSGPAITIKPTLQVPPPSLQDNTFTMTLQPTDPPADRNTPQACLSAG
jgi:hypothetical protein